MHSNSGVLWMIRCCSIGVVGFLLTGCSTSQYAPVQELGYSTAGVSVGSGVKNTFAPYQVKPGDTMFAIAWRFGWDYKKLAKTNGISYPYTIYVGQVIYFNDINDNYLVNQSASKKSVEKP
jgi:lipoprotein NlpD